MIVVDASAIVAISLNEPDGSAFMARIAGESEAITSAISFWEASVRVGGQRGDAGVADLERLISDLQIAIAAADEEQARFAVEAFSRFGRRTPANLNLGDCFSYALAKSRNAPLLFKGQDFIGTDIVAA